jgi:hypothetical protein
MDLATFRAYVTYKLRSRNLANTPADHIVNRPQHELWRHYNNPAQRAQAVCENVHWYGRYGNPVWVWTQGGNNPATVEALVRGQETQINCGGFNAVARWIGHNVLNIPATAFVGTGTVSTDCFITPAASRMIDRNWEGNVCTQTQSFTELGAYFFVGHAWCQFGATMLDASTGVMNFHTKTDLWWCELERRFGDPFMDVGRAYTVKNFYQPPPNPAASPYCVVSSTALRRFNHLLPDGSSYTPGALTQLFARAMQPTTGAGWATMLLVSRAALTPAFAAALNLP